MQYLAIFLLVGLGLASAYTSDFDGGLSIDRYEKVDEIPLEAGGWIADQMRQAFEKMVEGFEKALEEGKTISERAFRKAEEMYHKLLDWGIDVGEKVKEAFERISKDFENRNSHYEPEHAGGWIADQMRQAFEKMVEGFEKALEEGKTVSERAFRKAEEMYHKLLDWGIEISENIKEAFERIAENFDNNRHYEPEQAGGWIADQIKQAFEKMVEGFEKALEEGKTISERAFRKAEEMYHKLMDWGIEISEKVKEAFERISKDFDNRQHQPEQAGGWIADQMRQAFEKMVETFEKALEEGKTISERAFRKAEEMYHKLMDWGIEISEKVKEAFERISKDFENRNRRHQPKQAGGWIADQIKQAFEKMVEGFEKALEEGKTISERAFRKAEEMYHKLMDWGIEISEHIKEAFERISKDFENKSHYQREHAGGWIADQMRQAFEKMVEGFEKALEEGKTISERAFRKAEEMYHKLLDWGIDVGEKVKEAFERISKDFENRNSVQRGPVIDRLKEAFEKIVNTIKERFEGGEGVGGPLMKKAQDIFQKLKDMRVGGSWFEKMKQIFEDLKSKIGRNSVQRGAMIDRLKEAFENVVNKMKEAFENGKGVRGDLMKKAEDIYEKLKNLKVEISDKIKSIFEDLRNKMGRNGPVSQNADISNVLDLFRKLKKLIKEKFDAEKLKAKVEELFGKGSELSEQIIEMLKTKGEKAKQKILDWLDRIVPDKEERSISEVYEKLREFFKDLQLDLKERFSKFGEWVKEQYEKGLEKGKTRAENIKKIAKEFIADTKVIGKDMAEEALGFFREYKKDLGNLYDNVIDKISKILKS